MPTPARVPFVAAAIPFVDQQLVITVRLGDGMSTPLEVAAAVRNALYDHAGPAPGVITPFTQLPGFQQGPIHDEHGNLCGEWHCTT